MFGGNEGLRRMMSHENIKPTNVSQTLLRFGGYFKPYWLVLSIVGVFIVITTWTQVIAPELIGQAVDCYIAQPTGETFANIPGASALGETAQINCWYDENTTTLSNAERISALGKLILIIVGLYVASSLLTGCLFFGTIWVGQRVLRTIRIDVFQHLHKLSIGYYTKNEAGDLMSRLTNDAETISQMFNFGLIQIFSGGLLILWIAYNMLAKSIPYALISLLVVPLMVLTTVWFSNQARKAFRQTRTEMGSVNAELQESISAVREVQAFNRAEENIENFKVANAANRDANIRAVAFTSALSPALEALGYLGLAITTSVGGIALLRGQTLFGSTISLGVIITFLNYVQRFNQPIRQISMMWTNTQNAIAAGERIFNLLDIAPELENQPNAQPIPAIVGQVTFQDVSAAYNPDEPVLQNINLKIEPGQTVAIVGPTGAGKTTLINLIPRFYDTTGGQVLIDGLDVKSVTKESLRQQIGIVLQDTFLFSDTVMENIRFGKLDASDGAVIEAAKLAHADTFVERLPNSYQTKLGERGGGLSQGQRQLLSIARAALSDPHILILDEATSSVDTRTERLIQSALDKLLKGRTSFVIAHRLSTIRNADVVLVLDQGQIVEEGTHDSLLAQRGFYYNLYMSQFQTKDEAPAIPVEAGHTNIH